MRTLLVKFAGLTLYIHELQSSTLVLTHERPNKDPRVHKVYEEDFEDTADELEAEALEKLEPGVEASVEGLSLRLIKNDGVLNIVYEGKDGEIVDWKFQGLTGMMASVSTQTVSETQPKLSTSTIHAMAIDPAPQRMTWPLRSKLSSISSIETRPIKTLTKDEEEVPARAAVGAGENEHEHKKTKHTLRSPPHELARTTHESRPWPNHLFMACYRLRPISESDIGILHIDLVEGTVWYEAWHGRAHVSQQTYMRKQVDLRNVSTSVEYLPHSGCSGQDYSTHQLRLSRVNTKGDRVAFFSADCSAPGYQVWGSNTYKSLGPIPCYSILAWDRSRKATGIPFTIPDLPHNTTERHTSPIVIIDALVHCIDRASGRQAIHNPALDRVLHHKIFKGFLDMARTCSCKEYMVRWIAAIQESKKRKAKKRTMRVVKMANEKKVSIKKPKAAKSTETRAVKRSGQSLDTKEKEAKKAKIGRRSVEEVWRECFPGRHSE
ncbi:hypothetical protein CC77DRAFT_1056667 [Alternaria alternata]|uniref:Uncharacterized protein n=1 Tax=Alternaria alternata TaxID=5599 RepID=A0A177E4F0_ALTAL|nr:hypothetical protein CC77DRAFT_1056667 [Alternaria alternata]OAG26606.1 hypothetical protein CC77DRAFT_1056667 [Alternaria alternata]